MTTSPSILKAVARITPDVEAFRRDLAKAGKTMETELGRASTRTGKRAGEELGRGVERGATDGARRAGTAIDRELAGKMKNVGNKMTMAITAPVIGIATASAKMAMGFETSMAKITALVGIPRAEVQAWEDDVRNLAKTYGSSAGDAADALFFITSAGLRGQDAMDALQMSLKASAVGLGDVTTIADLATSAMNAYGPANLSAAQAGDILTATIREGKIEASLLSGAMGATLPMASALGVELDEVGAAFAAMSRTGTKATEAATQLNGILMTIQNPSAQARKELERMGLSAEGLRAQLRDKGLISTLTTLKESFGENEEAAALVFNNSRALRGVLDMLGAGAADTANIFAALTDTSGTLDTAFGVMSDTTEFELRQAWAEMKDEMLEIGNVLIPVVKDLAEAISGIADAFSGLDPWMKKAIVYAGLLAAAAGPFIRVAGSIMQIAGAHRMAAVAAGQHAMASKAVGAGGMGGKAAMLAGGKVGLVAAAGAAAYFGTKHLLESDFGGGSVKDRLTDSAAVGWLADQMPGMAAGGTVTRSGLVEVGERGREVLALPAGAQVSPNGGLTDLAQRLDRIAELLSAGTVGGMHVEVINAAGMDERRLARELDGLNRRASAVRTTTRRTA
jgi:TP901 family phage tail tape measure protein